MANTIQIHSVSWPDPPREGEYGFAYCVGYPARVMGRTDPVEITAITIQDDVPGLHGDLRRVCVWSGNTLVAEGPYTSIEHCVHLTNT